MLNVNDLTVQFGKRVLLPMAIATVLLEQMAQVNPLFSKW